MVMALGTMAVAMIMTVIMVMVMVMVVVMVMTDARCAMLVGVGRCLETSDAPRDRDACHERSGQPQPIMRMELKLGEKVRRGDAQERTRAEGERQRQNSRTVSAHSGHERQRPERHDGRKQRIHQVTAGGACARGRKHGRERHRIKGLVKQHHKHDAQTCEGSMTLACAELDGGGDRDALECAVKPKSRERANPSTSAEDRAFGRVAISGGMHMAARATMRVCVIAPAAAELLRRLVAVVVEETRKHEHHHEPKHGCAHDGLEAVMRR